MNFTEARAQFAADKARYESLGAILPGATSFLPDEFRHNFAMAMDAQPALSTDPNSSIPWFMTNLVDPEVYKVLFTPNKAAIILTEVKKGDWTTRTAMFPVVEHEGEVSSYGDYNENGHTGANANWPARQSYLFQTMKEWGDLEIAQAGEAKLNWIAEIDAASALALNKAQNLSYFFGVQSLQNYGLLNDPHLSAALTPSPKAFGNNKWITNGVITATPNEVYNDIMAMVTQLVVQSGGNISQEDEMKLVLSPTTQMGLSAANSFGTKVKDLLKDVVPKLTFETAIQYGALTAANPQGVVGGEFAQLIAKQVEGQKTGYCAFNEKMRAHKMVYQTSSYKQKVTAGSWGAILRTTITISSMIGL